MATTKKEETMEATAKVYLPISEENQDDEWVSINGKTWQIQRGVEVEVPLCVKEVLDNKERMRMVAIKRSKELQDIAKGLNK